MATNAIDAVGGDYADAMPLIASAAESPWSRAERQRDVFAAEIAAVLDAQRLRGLVEKSQPGVFPPQVVMTVWSRQDERADSSATSRGWVSITIDVNPYLEHPLIIALEAMANGRTAARKDWDITPDDVRATVRWVLGHDVKPQVLKGHKRRALYDMMAGMTPLAFFRRERNPIIDEARPPRFTLVSALVMLGGALVLLGLVSGIFLLPGIAAWVAAAVLSARRELVHSVVKRPEISPRRLFLVDSWHTSVPEVGTRFADLAGRIEARLQRLDASILKRWEEHSYRTAYRIETQRRLTLTRGQAVVHVHLYPIADQAFVGWDGYLNWACWAETKAISRAIRGQRAIEYRNLAIGAYVPTDFDLVEFNVLSELVHGQIVAEVRAFLKEQAIEADLDFKIIRGDRDHALAAGSAGEERGARRRARVAAG